MKQDETKWTVPKVDTSSKVDGSSTSWLLFGKWTIILKVDDLGPIWAVLWHEVEPSWTVHFCLNKDHLHLDPIFGVKHIWTHQSRKDNADSMIKKSVKLSE